MIGLILIVVVASVVILYTTREWFELIWIFLVLFFLAWIPPIRRYFSMLSITAEASKAMAAASGARYIAISKPNYQKHFLPAIARVGWWERYEQRIKTELDGKQFETFVATFREPYTRRISRVAARVYCVHLPKELPHIVLLNRQSGNRYLNSLPRHFDDDQRVGLEGNFDTFFVVYTHRRTVTDALGILSPNFMETLRDANKAYDVEFVGSRLYLYTDDYLMEPDELKDAIKTTKQLMKHVDHRLKSLKLVLPNNKHFPYMQSRAGYGTMIIGGKYYNRSWLAILGYNVWVGLQLAINQSYFMIKVGTAIFFNIVLITSLLVLRRRYQLRNRNVSR